MYFLHVVALLVLTILCVNVCIFDIFLVVVVFVSCHKTAMK